MIDVLYEDNHLLVVNKPAMLATMGVAGDRPSLLTLAKEYVRQRFGKPGNVYLGVVSRLDAPVTGIVLLARTSKAAARLTEQFRERRVEKVYWALVEGHVEPPAAQLRHYLRKDERHRRMHVCVPSAPGAQQAELAYRALDADGDAPRIRAGSAITFLEVQLLTGRKHQIRVQLAEAGFPIVGDRKYGGRRTFPSGIALHARRLVFEHPVRRTPMALEAPVPESWREHLDGAH
ncbi:MAG: RluA family pseudouridine synthase [Pirellulales bacterium]